VLPGALAAVASARGATLLAGAASGVYWSQEDLLALAPDPDRSVRPGDASGAFEAAYARYRELYPSLYG
jgi:sugar (pentulose or hexulose) kinase